jgi:predicted dienelactone hydrolase
MQTPERPSSRLLLAVLLCVLASLPCLAVSSESLFKLPAGVAPVPEGKDVIVLSQGGKVGYRVLKVTATDDAGTRTTTSVAVWYPTADAEKPFAYAYGENKVRTTLALNGKVAAGRYPVVVFSHGATGSGLTSAFVTETLARHGFIVAAVDHTDEVYLVRIVNDPALAKQQGVAVKALAYAAKVRNEYLGDDALKYRSKLSYRPAQIRATIDLLLGRSSPFAGHVNADKVGVMGHSFGAWTTMVVAGGIKKYADPRVDAAVTLSAPVNGTVFSPQEVEGIKTPMMMMFGSTEVLQGRGDDRTHFYDHLGGSRYMVEIEDAVHTTFSGGIRYEHPSVQGYLGDENRAAITRYAIAMMGYYLKGDARARAQLQIRGNGVTHYLYQEKK